MWSKVEQNAWSLPDKPTVWILSLAISFLPLFRKFDAKESWMILSKQSQLSILRLGHTTIYGHDKRWGNFRVKIEKKKGKRKFWTQRGKKNKTRERKIEDKSLSRIFGLDQTHSLSHFSRWKTASIKHLLNPPNFSCQNCYWLKVRGH